MPGDHVPIRQQNNEKQVHGNILSQTRGDKEAPEPSRDFPIFSKSKFIPSNSTSSLINHKQSTDAVRTSTHSSIPTSKQTPTPSKIARSDAANIAARISSAQRTRPPASASRGRVASAVVAAAAFADAPTVPAPVRAASRAASAEQAPAPLAAPSTTALTGESKRGA
jgi:hypothetical protein